MAEIDQYDYDLPRELIAQYPLPCRSDARLLLVERRLGRLTHHHVRDLPDLLAPADTLVVNDTRVVPARLVGRREQTGGRWQGLFLEQNAQGHWHVLAKSRSRPRLGEWIEIADRDGRPAFRLQLLARLPDGSWAVQPDRRQPAWELLEACGRVPLPPYIRGGAMVDADLETYQTVYARHRGAVAAPTAGLHFTPALLEQLEQRGLAVCAVTLHVGAGTFRPIASPQLDDHAMHREWGQISSDAVELLKCRHAAGGRRVAVGTTSVRVLETAAQGGELRPWRGETELFIRPPFTFQAVDGLLTNFHLPRSSLLVLVAAFAGLQLIRAAYQEAVAERYRFYSYGDAMLIL